jgi:hypothetical protein
MEDVGILSILRPNSTFYRQTVHFIAILVYFVVIWYILPVLECCTEKNLATLVDPSRAGSSLRLKPARAR